MVILLILTVLVLTLITGMRMGEGRTFPQQRRSLSQRKSSLIRQIRTGIARLGDDE